MKIRFGMIGSGWRAEFFIRIAKALPELFDLAVVMIRDAEKGRAFSEKHQVPVVQTIEELVSYQVEYVVLSVNRGVTSQYLTKLFQMNVPVLCETPPATDVETLEMIWKQAKQYNARIQVAEQYFAQPLFAAWQEVIHQGKLGEVQNISLSIIHGYHAMSIVRRYLDAGMGNCKIIGKQFEFQATKTGSRLGMHFEGEIISCKRDRLTLEFENGKVAYYDFCGDQYLSFIRSRQLQVQGTRGEIDDLEIRYLTDENVAIHTKLNRTDLGVYNIQGWEHYGIMLNDTYIYKNPFEHARLNDDEIAVATCMYKMREYLETGRELYSLKEACQDAYLGIMMGKALENAYVEIETETQVWAER